MKNVKMQKNSYLQEINRLLKIYKILIVTLAGIIICFIIKKIDINKNGKLIIRILYAIT